MACDPGDREVLRLEFVGNATFPDRELALRINTTPSAWARRTLRFTGARRCLDERELAGDVLRLQTFYRRRGFYEAKVDTNVTPVRGTAVRVRFDIVEGAPVLVDSVAILGIAPLSPAVRAELLAGVGIAKGMRFDREQIRATSDSIRSRLWNSGYPRADVAEAYDVRTAERRARVELTVVPGRLAWLGDIRVRVDSVPGKGQQISDETVRRLSGLRSGALYRENDLVRAQRSLYQTNSYRHVDVRIVAPNGRTGAAADTLTVEIDLREDLQRQVDTEVGWATLDCFRTRAQYVDKNFMRGARRLELNAQVSKIGYGYPLDQARGLCYEQDLRRDPFSDTLHYFVGATLRQPAVFGTRFTPAFSLYRERRGEFLAFLRTTLIGGEASASRELRPGTPLRLAYNVEYGRTEAQPALLCFLFSRCDQESRDRLSGRALPLAVASAVIARNRTDDPVAPTRGSRVTGELRTSSRLLGSDPSLQFNRASADAVWYRPLGAGSVLATRVRLGAVLGASLSFGDSVRFVPPQERLYAGGATSVRGFQQNELGQLVYIARDQPDTVEVGGVRTVQMDGERRVLRVVPTGGNTLVVANVELRLRDPFFPEFLQYTLFTDVGEVWDRSGERGRGSFPALKWTPGAGVRVATPVGPFQVNVAYNPYRQPTGAVYFDAPVNAVTGNAPLFCVTPGNTIPLADQEAGRTSSCPATFRPDRPQRFFSKLTFTVSIGPEF